MIASQSPAHLPPASLVQVCVACDAILLQENVEFDDLNLS